MDDQPVEIVVDTATQPKKKRKPRVRIQELHKKNCIVCGIEFMSERSDSLYCSTRCQSRAQRLRTKAMNTQYLNAQLTQLGHFMHLLPKEYAKMLKELGDLFGTEVAYETAVRLMKILNIPYQLASLPPDEKS
jgi:hypothetical protein